MRVRRLEFTETGIAAGVGFHPVVAPGWRRCRLVKPLERNRWVVETNRGVLVRRLTENLSYRWIGAWPIPRLPPIVHCRPQSERSVLGSFVLILQPRNIDALQN
jgi:hypothetical protein